MDGTPIGLESLILNAHGSGGPKHEQKRIELQQALQAAVLERTSEIARAAADVVRAEAQSQS